ncbi:hypothetical protein [Butyrivibrio fibrisolvens]|uniref:hypothetical protein n=1 Tax=Butyrivibrio fibrisolvens TaxID=831 RepID=UPI000403CCAD|nr:hypothetical protein [Butyrivibrio fibrisolvens]
MKAYYHLPGLFEFYEFYKVFLPIFREHREYFYDWCDIGSIYGAPGDCLWGGGRVGFGDADPVKVKSLMEAYNISMRLTFSNSMLMQEHLSDPKCNELCAMFEGRDVAATCDYPKAVKGVAGAFEDSDVKKNGIIIHSDLLLDYIKKKYPGYYFVSSTTKVLTDFEDLCMELDREDFDYVVPDFRLNKEFDKLSSLTDDQKDKVEFLCNECCFFGCYDRKKCYENVSLKCLGQKVEDHICVSPDKDKGYRFSDAMNNPGFIGIDDIQNIYLPMGFSNFKIEGRSLGSAIILEFLLYYMTKPSYQLKVREEIYLDSSLDLF